MQKYAQDQVLVYGATTFRAFPNDNPVIDFTLIIQSDGSVEVQDT